MTWLPGLPRTEAGLIIGLVAIGIAIVVALLLGRWRGAEVAGLGLIALTPLVPTLPTPIGIGLTTDDILPLTGLAILLVQLLRTQGIRRSPLTRLQAGLVVGLALVIVGGVISAVLNAQGVPELARLLLKGAGHFALLGLIVWIVGATVARRPSLIMPTAQALAWMGSIEAAFGLIAYIFPLPGHLGLAKIKPTSVLAGDVPGRIAGTLGISPDFTGAILMVTLLVTVGLALRSNRNVRIWWLGSAAIQLVALTLTFARAPLALAAIGVVAVLVLSRRPILLIPVAAATAAVTLFTPLVGRFLSDANDRFALWTAAVRMMFDYPVAGVGPGDSVAVLRSNPERYMTTGFGSATDNAHNTVLLAGAEMGVLAAMGALVLNIGLALGALVTIRDGLAKGARDELLVASGVAILAILAQGMVNNLFTVEVTSVILALLAGTFVWARESVAATAPAGATSSANTDGPSDSYPVATVTATLGSNGPSGQ